MLAAVRILAGVTAATGWVALALQFGIILQATSALQATGAISFPILAAAVVFLSFLSLQINLLAALVATCAAIGVTRFARAGRLRSALAAYLVSGLIIFLLALEPSLHHYGMQSAADVLLHYVTPVLYGAFWLAAVPKDRLRWRDPLIWLVYPAAYVAVMLVFARFSGFYPYPMLDFRFLDPVMLLFNLVALAVIFLAIGFATVALARAVELPKA